MSIVCDSWLSALLNTTLLADGSKIISIISFLKKLKEVTTLFWEAVIVDQLPPFELIKYPP